MALTGASCTATCEAIGAFCAPSLIPSMALWHAFDEQGQFYTLYLCYVYKLISNNGLYHNSYL